MSYKKRDNLNLSFGNTGFYDSDPLKLFNQSGREWVPICNWLRLCPFNETTRRWHIPMKKEKSEAIYWNIYQWMRKNEYDYQCQINQTMGENRCLFIDTAQVNNQKDFWLVADEFRRIDMGLFIDPERSGIRYAPNFQQTIRSEDLMIPDFRGKWINDNNRQPGGKVIDPELRESFDLAYKSMESMALKTRFIKG